MTQNTRRKILKGAFVTLPAAWTAPLVKSVVLPAHAQISSDEGCYQVLKLDGVPKEVNASFYWPGGTGPFDTDGFENINCASESTYTTSTVLASSEGEAAKLLNCGQAQIVGVLETSPPPPAGYTFFICEGLG